ncbi:MAG: hypothetical protein SFX18_15155 [Pirellulales bacterium]|nr:hypothetical protein [Pirellulales bacterium]
MAKAKITNSDPPPAGPGILSRAKGWLSASGGTLLVFLLAGGAVWALWQNVRHSVLARQDYLLEPREVRITPLPPWIRTDIKSEALRAASLDPPLSLLDEKLPQRLERALALHPWVERVNRVQLRYPAAVEIELIYRQPVAMLEVSEGLLPVDKNCVILPTADFTPLDTKNYLRLAGLPFTQTVTAGSVWNEPLAKSAVQLAVRLQDVRIPAKLSKISWVPAPHAARDWERQFVLETQTGKQLIWGEPIGREQPGEPDATAKLAALQKILSAPAGLEGLLELMNLDLSQPQNWPAELRLSTNSRRLP